MRHLNAFMVKHGEYGIAIYNDEEDHIPCEIISLKDPEHLYSKKYFDLIGHNTVVNVIYFLKNPNKSNNKWFLFDNDSVLESY